jgi:uncharacterized membrane protein
VEPPEPQTTTVPPRKVEVIRIVWPAFTFACFAFVVVIGVLKPDRFDRFGFAVAVAFALAYAVRLVLRIRQMLRRRAIRTGKTVKAATFDD